MKIGVLYNLVEQVVRGSPEDAVSDNAVLDSVDLVREALKDGNEVIPIRISREILIDLPALEIDVVFNLCEGFEGNVKAEAWIPAYLDLLGIPYTGSGCSVLANCLDKWRTKDLLTANGLPTPGYQLFRYQNTKLSSSLRFPLIAKPSGEDASVGIGPSSVVYCKADLYSLVDELLIKYKQPVLVEEYIDGRELNIAVLGNRPRRRVLPVSEITFDLPAGHPRIVTYEAKWVAESQAYKGTRGVCPAKLPDLVLDHIEHLAVEAVNVMGCRDYSRVDIRLDGDEPWIIEVNPNPDIGPGSGFQRSAKAAGMTPEALTQKIFDMALERKGGG